MPLQLVRNDITKIECDAIVNAANESLLGGGGVDGAIHRAAGPELLAECRTLGGCEPGQAKLTKGYRLPCQWVIHTVGPRWHGGSHGERETLRDCYRNSLLLAEKKGCETVAFPLISSGAYGYPKREALQVAVETITAFLLEHEMTVILTLFDRSTVLFGEKITQVREYVDDHYVEEYKARDSREHPGRYRWGNRLPREEAAPRAESAAFPYPGKADAASFAYMEPAAAKPQGSLDDALKSLDESFTQMLLRKIDERGMKDPECYKKANISRKLFSKIRSDPYYKPSKPTVLAFAIALELDLEETREMLMKAGFALSHSSKFDVIVEYYIRNRNYNIFEINEALFAFDQMLLGA